MPKPIYYPQTTVEQRMQLFNQWEITGNVSDACAKLQLSRATFYYWKDRFLTGGYSALAQDPSALEEQSATAALPIATTIADEIRALKAAHPHWSKWQILRALRASHPFSDYINIDTIRHVLDDAMLL